LEIIEYDTPGCQIELNRSGELAGNLRTSQKTPEISQTFPAAKRENHGRYSLENIVAAEAHTAAVNPGLKKAALNQQNTVHPAIMAFCQAGDETVAPRSRANRRADKCDLRVKLFGVCPS
jgi:hypothetical protein